MTIPNDEYFAKAIESTFKSVQEAGDASIKMNNVMQVIKLMRQRLLTVSNNSQEEYVLRNIFRTFDTDKSGYITLNELAGMLAHLQVYVEDNCLQAVMRELDANKSGTIEFEEFCEFMIINPYKWINKF